MTLVAGLSVGGLPAFIGDLLISWRIPSSVDLPTQQNEWVQPGFGGDYAAGLAQKLIIVRRYLMIAWAGERSDVDRMARELDAVLPFDAAELRTPDVIFEILNTCGEGTELIALLIWGNAIFPFGVRTRGFELDNRRIYLLGTGASEFFNFLQTDPDLIPTNETADGLLARASMLRFAARSMMTQLIVGSGLRNSWGGGFEIAYPAEGGFRKIGNLMFRAWMIDEEGGYHNSGRSFFLRYYGNDLHLSWFGLGERTYTIRSPIGNPSRIPEYEEVHPEWTLDAFVVKKTAAFVEFARFQPPHRPVMDHVKLKNGSLVGWEMDQEFVEHCVKVALSAADRGTHSQMWRY